MLAGSTTTLVNEERSTTPISISPIQRDDAAFRAITSMAADNVGYSQDIVARVMNVGSGPIRRESSPANRTSPVRSTAFIENLDGFEREEAQRRKSRPMIGSGGIQLPKPRSVISGPPSPREESQFLIEQQDKDGRSSSFTSMYSSQEVRESSRSEHRESQEQNKEEDIRKKSL